MTKIEAAILAVGILTMWAVWIAAQINPPRR